MGTIAAALDTGDLIGSAPEREMEQPPMEHSMESMPQGQMMPPEGMPNEMQ